MRHLHFLPFCISLLFLASCGSEDGPGEPQGPIVTVPQAPTLEERDEWQRPHELISMIMIAVDGNTIADLFAGDGYFTFHMIDAGANVIAMDTDPANIASLEAGKKERGLGDDRLQIRHVEEGTVGLQAEEADAAILVHNYTRINDRSAYFKQLREGLRGRRPLFIVDWQNRQTPMGPPLDERISTDRVMDELRKYGYHEVGAHSAKMLYQVIFLATDPVMVADDEYQQAGDQFQVRPLE